MMRVTQRKVNHKAMAACLVAPTSDSGQVTMIVLGDSWVAEVPRNSFGSDSLESRIKILETSEICEARNVNGQVKGLSAQEII